jgi:hypothetical protein
MKQVKNTKTFKNNKTHLIDKKSIKKCEETKCKVQVSDMLSQSKVMLKFVSKTIQTCKKLLNDPDLEKRKSAKATMKRLLPIMNKMSKPGYLEKRSQVEMKICKRLYCNPMCKGTSKHTNNFSNSLDNKLIIKLKKDGAVSGCV